MEVFRHLGAWSWMILAAILFVLELMAPGIFFMWFGLAAAVTGLIAFGFDVSWQWQLIWFGLLSLAAIFFAIKYLRKHPLHSERPLLNERAVQHIGEVHPSGRRHRQWAGQRQDRRLGLARGGSRAAPGRAGQDRRRRRDAAESGAGAADDFDCSPGRR